MIPTTTTRAAYVALGIPQETAARLEACASRIEAGAKLTGEGILQIGAALNEARAEFGDNDRAFGQWRKARLPWLEERTALRFQQVAERFGADPRQIVWVSRMPRSALYALAAPSTPAQVVDQALDLAETGERVTLAAVRELMARAVDPPTIPAPRRPVTKAAPEPAAHADTPLDAAAQLTGELRRFASTVADQPAALATDPAAKATWAALYEQLETVLATVRARLRIADEKPPKIASEPRRTAPIAKAKQTPKTPQNSTGAPVAAPQETPNNRRALAAIGHRWRQEGMTMSAIAAAFNERGWTPNRIGKPGAAPRADSAKEWTLKAVSQLLMRDYTPPAG